MKNTKLWREHDEVDPGLARHGYMLVDDMRYLVFYTSKERARNSSYDMSWDIASIRDVINHMFYRHR